MSEGTRMSGMEDGGIGEEEEEDDGMGCAAVIGGGGGDVRERLVED